MFEEESDDRRNFDRFLARFPAKFKDSRNDYGTDVFLRDISAEGAKLLTRQKMFLNDSVSVQLKLPDGYESLILKGEVVWSKNSNNHHFEVGMRFHRVDLIDLQRLFQYCVEE